MTSSSINFYSTNIYVKRRDLMIAAVGLAASASQSPAMARSGPATEENTVQSQQTPAGPRRVDVHHHYIPPEYRSALIAAGRSRPSGMPGIPAWTVEQSLEIMDRVGTEVAMLSVVNGVHFGDDTAARDLSRHVNEAGAQAVQGHPTRLGLFATLPLPNIDNALTEIHYAFEVLNADGVIMSSNYQGIYLGDARFDSIFAELNRRNAVVFIHPNDPHCECCASPMTLQPLGYPIPMMEFMFDTTRTVFNLILSGMLAKYPNVKIIVPHAGALLPALADRVSALSTMLNLGSPQDPVQIRKTLKGLYYDLAGWSEPVALSNLIEMADPTHIFFGSDYPYTPGPLAVELAHALDQSEKIPPELRAEFMRNNALALFSRLRT